VIKVNDDLVRLKLRTWLCIFRRTLSTHYRSIHGYEKRHCGQACTAAMCRITLLASKELTLLTLFEMEADKLKDVEKS